MNKQIYDDTFKSSGKYGVDYCFVKLSKNTIYMNIFMINTLKSDMVKYKSLAETSLLRS